MESSWGRHKPISIKGVYWLSGVCVSAIAALGTVMAATNPSQAAYETYATNQLIHQIDTQVCAEAPKTFNLQNQCRSLLKSNRAQIRQLISDGTQRRNFIFFSIYSTDISIASFAPSLRVEAIGAFQQFRVYEAFEH